MQMSDSVSNPGLGGSVADLHQKSSAAYSGEMTPIIIIWMLLNRFRAADIDQHLYTLNWFKLVHHKD